MLASCGVRCEVFAGEGELASDRCEILGLIVAELVTNAAKHAFPDGASGRVRVEVFESKAGWRCVVYDDGVGMNNVTRGAGSRLVAMLAACLQARIEICSSAAGTSIALSFPH
jgi:two-component sensor histidine kinase